MYIIHKHVCTYMRHRWCIHEGTHSVSVHNACYIVHNESISLCILIMHKKRRNVTHGQLSRTFGFDIKLGIMSYEIQKVNSPLIHAKGHSNKVSISHF